MNATQTAEARRQSRRLGGPEPTRSAPPQDDLPPAVRPKWSLIERQEHARELRRLQDRISELENEIMTYRKNARERREAQLQAESAVALYGDKTELAEAKSRIALHPAFAELPPQGQSLVVQLATTMRLNPFTHIHAWVDKRNTLQITLDYKGLWYLANPDNLVESTRALTPAEMRERGISQEDIDKGARAALCEITEIDKAERLARIGMAYKPVVGYGVWYPVQAKTSRKGEVYTIDSEPANGRDPQWMADKRALRAALYKVSDLGLRLSKGVDGLAVNDDGWQADLDEPVSAAHDDAIEGTFTEREAVTASEPQQSSLFDAPSDEPEMCPDCGQHPVSSKNPFGTCEACAKAKADAEAVES